MPPTEPSLVRRRRRARAIRSHPLGRLAVAACLACGSAAPLHAATTEARFSVVRIDPPPGFSVVRPTAINDAGVVVGHLTSEVNGTLRSTGFVQRDGAVQLLPRLTGFNLSRPIGISADGRTVVGNEGKGTDVQSTAVVWRDGVPSFAFSGLGSSQVRAMAGDGSFAGGLQLAGQPAQAYVVPAGAGAATILGTSAQGARTEATAISADRVAGWLDGSPVVWRDGRVEALLPPGTVSAFDLSFGAISAAGVVGGSWTPVPNGNALPVLIRDGRMTVLPASGSVRALDDAGWAAGAFEAGGLQNAAAWYHGTPLALGDLPAFAQAGLVSPRSVTAMNARGQMTGLAFDAASSVAGGYVLTATDVAFVGGSMARWEDAASWARSFGPVGSARVHLDPGRTLTVLGPTGLSRAASLELGSRDTAPGPVTTLRLEGGTLELLGRADLGLAAHIGARGVLAGSGQLASLAGTPLRNEGRIAPTDIAITGGRLVNAGRIDGSGRLVVAEGIGNEGLVQPVAGGTLTLAAALDNTGRVEVLRGARLEVGALANAGTGRILLGDATLATAGLDNDGRLDISGGRVDVLGGVANRAGGRVVVSGLAETTFWDEVVQAGEWRVSAGSVATFFGNVTVAAGAGFTGGGRVLFEAGLAVDGALAGMASAGDLGLGEAARLQLRLGEAGADRLSVDGLLSLDGTLQLSSTGPALQAGQRFDLLDWRTLAGRFTTLGIAGLHLAPGTWLDDSLLYVDGSVQVVPEPATALLWLAGAAGLLAARRRVRT